MKKLVYVLLGLCFTISVLAGCSKKSKVNLMGTGADNITSITFYENGTEKSIECDSEEFADIVKTVKDNENNVVTANGAYNFVGRMYGSDAEYSKSMNAKLYVVTLKSDTSLSYAGYKTDKAVKVVIDYTGNYCTIINDGNEGDECTSFTAAIGKKFLKEETENGNDIMGVPSDNIDTIEMFDSTGAKQSFKIDSEEYTKIRNIINQTENDKGIIVGGFGMEIKGDYQKYSADKQTQLYVVKLKNNQVVNYSNYIGINVSGVLVDVKQGWVGMIIQDKDGNVIYLTFMPEEK